MSVARNSGVFVPHSKKVVAVQVEAVLLDADMGKSKSRSRFRGMLY
jgi:hypothetical protein